ncbi:hypothetical protein FRC11_011730 [Ceratobasidium sp. 423]|nr:hypothetical protein FRC11_011730 [Ceratobasidium sp. 423]
MKAVSFGAETLLAETKELAESNRWTLAKNFGLHLFSESMRSRYNANLDPLPPGVSLLQVYTDYLRYLLNHTREYFQNWMVDGSTLWARYGPTIEVVITHPNGWGIREQTLLRNAAIGAGYANAKDSLTKISLLDEIKASVYFGLYRSNLSRVVDTTTFLLCGAGEEIIDVAVFTIVSRYPAVNIREERAPTCIRAGSALIDLKLEQYLRQLLSGAGHPDEIVDEYTDAGISDFKSHARRTFREEAQSVIIKLGEGSFNDNSIGVRRGCLIFSGPLIKSYFDDCVRDILTAVDEQMQGLNVSHILLIGAFGNTSYLQQQFKKHFEPRGCQLSTPDLPATGAESVATGAVLWRVNYPLHTYQVSWGIETSVLFDRDNPDHQHRKAITSTSGGTVLPGRWKGLVKRDVPLDDDHAVVIIPFSLEFPSCPAELGKFELGLYSYSGDGEPPYSLLIAQGKLLAKFRKIGSIQSDLENLRGALELQIALDGFLQWQLDFDVCIQFGGHEPKAYLEWKEKVLIAAHL